MFKKIALGLAGILLLMQLYRPAKNNTNDQTFHIAKKYPVPDSVAAILDVACNDCHSNNTRYPIYAEIQPVALWLSNHVNEGKEHLNFSKFTNLPIAVQNHKLEETIEMINEGEMPLHSYTWLGLHSEAKLSDAQKKMLVHWAQTQMDSLKAQYPADSLVLRRKGPPAK